MVDVDVDDLDLIFMCTSTPDNLFGDAPQVQRDLGYTKTPITCEIRAACSGFMLGLFSVACYVRGDELFLHCKVYLYKLQESIETALKKASLTASGIDWLLLHQANQRIIDVVATRLEFPPKKVISNLENYGNTSAASIPLELDEAVRSGKVKQGHTIAAAGFGAGLTWTSTVIRLG
ncbi:hypothetical protein GQ457_03G019770 [Hibiscus cannabinus]